MDTHQEEPAPRVFNETEKVEISDKLARMKLIWAEDDAKEAEAKRLRESYDTAPLSEQHRYMYNQCLAVAQASSQAELLTTYMQDWYNPDNPKLDALNTQLNLIFLRNLLRFSVMDFSFTSEPRAAAVDDPRLGSDSWKPIMEDETLSEPEKHLKIAEKWIRGLFYKNLFFKLHEKADTGTYNNSLYKQDLISSEDENFTFEKGVARYVEQNTTDESVILSSKNTLKYFNYDEERETFEPKDIYHKGRWRNRHIQLYDPLTHQYMKGVPSSVFVIHRGKNQQNQITVDPRKPLVYYQLIENPMLDQPTMLTYLNVDFDFLNTATVGIHLNPAMHQS